MIKRIAHWFLLPCSQKHYTAWLRDWRRPFVALLYPLFALGLIALVVAGICAAFQEIPFSVGAAVLSCVSFSLWWSWRMSKIQGVDFTSDDLQTRKAFEDRLHDNGFENAGEFLRRRGSDYIMLGILVEGGSVQLLKELAAKYPTLVAEVAPFLCLEAPLERENDLIALIESLTVPQGSRFFEKVEASARTRGFDKLEKFARERRIDSAMLEQAEEKRQAAAWGGGGVANPTIGGRAG